MPRHIKWFSRSICLALGLSCLVAVHAACAQDTTVLPQAQVGKPYSISISIDTENGKGQLTWKLAHGDLPPGLQVSVAGKIEGTPTETKSEPYVFELSVSDSSQPPHSATLHFTLSVAAPALSITVVNVATTQLKVLGVSTIEAAPGASASGRSSAVMPEPVPVPSAPPPLGTPLTKPGEAQPTPDPPRAATSDEPAHLGVRPVSTLYRLSDAIRALPSATIGGQAAPGSAAPPPPPSPKPPSSFSPATFVCLYEDTAAGDRYWIYRSDSTAKCNSATSSKIKSDFISEGATRLLSADENSTIVINLDPDRMGQDLPFNKVFISAQMGFGNQQKNLEVEGYSMVGVAKENTAAQRGVAFQSVRDVQAQVARMAEIAEDILRFVLPPPAGTRFDLTNAAGQPRDSALRSTLAGTATAPGPEMVARLEEMLRLYRKEISDASDFLNAPQNLSIVQFIATDVLPIGSRSLMSAASQVKEDLATALDGQSKDLARSQALLALWDRNVRLYQHFAPLRAEVDRLEDMDSSQIAALQFPPYPQSRKQELSDAKAGLGTITVSQCRQGPSVEQMEPCAALRVAAVKLVAARLGITANEALKKLFAQGSFSLRANGAKAGNIVTLTVQALGADGATVGIPSVWEIEVKKFGLKHDITDSLLFLYRLNLSKADTAIPPMATPTTPAPLKAINFSPSPGVTLGLTYYKRGNTGWSKFMRGLAPGLGVNVSFMNFSDPSFDLSTGTFTNTNGTNVQVGTGVVYSIFDNAIQFSSGWNLNVDRKRAYFGIGFSFVKFTEKVAAVVKK